MADEDKVLSTAPPPGQTDNLTTLENLNEESLLLELKVRYQRNVMYTYVGEILVAINPFKQIQGLYSDETMRKYSNIGDRSAHPPHLFAVADSAFNTMASSPAGAGANQVAVISGESGAGKTESAKLFIKHIINLSTKATGGGAGEAGGVGLEEKIVQLNPLLESFGNAQTLMNDNSSRFGKFIELRFNASLQITGAIQYDYLLEKSRVVRQTAGERNFHVFYLLFAGLTGPDLATYQLSAPGTYTYINGNPEAIAGIPGMKPLWLELREGLDIIGFDPDEVTTLLKTLSAILSIGNITFSGDEQAQVAGDGAALKRAADLLSTDSTILSAALTSMTTVTRGESITRAYKPFEAEAMRDAFAKAIYERIFRWIIRKVNDLLGPKEKSSIDKTIGILDIFGFECFDTNSFEQLLINLANEQLQFFFNNHIFKMELDEYAREGIDGSKISYEDNQAVLDMLLQKPIGLLAICDEESLFPKGSDASMIEKMHGNLTKLKGYARPPGNQVIFTISHYAGKVTYQGEGFLLKNRDSLAVDVIVAMQMSNDDLLASLFGAEHDPKAKKGAKKDVKKDIKKLAAAMEKSGKKTTVGGEFKLSLAQLMTTMNAAAPHFVRCIKPNMIKKPDVFVDDLTTKQLRYTGMLETTRIRKEGYANRPTFADFLARYKIIAFPMMSTPPPTASSCQAVLNKAGITGWQVGKSKVFLRFFHLDELNQVLKPYPLAALQIQRVSRGFTARRKYKVFMADKQRYLKLVDGFCERVAKTTEEVQPILKELNEIDDARPKDFWTKKQVKPKEDSELKKLNKKAQQMKKKAGSGDVSREQSVKWFKEIELKKGAGMRGGAFNEWFHGILTRKQAEDMLKKKPAGTFLVRVSESRFGYSLSHCVSEGGRIKHYMIDQTIEGKYQVVGNRKLFPSLNALVDWHMSHNIVAEDPVCLIQACGQIGQENDLEELIDKKAMAKAAKDAAKKKQAA